MARTLWPGREALGGVFPHAHARFAVPGRSWGSPRISCSGNWPTARGCITTCRSIGLPADLRQRTADQAAGRSQARAGEDVRAALQRVLSRRPPTSWPDRWPTWSSTSRRRGEWATSILIGFASACPGGRRRWHLRQCRATTLRSGHASGRSAWRSAQTGGLSWSLIVGPQPDTS